jgi:hypothetical protein
MQYKITLVISFCLCSFIITAQEFSAGFRAGLNFATINGPSEMSAEGSELEEYGLGSGFHVGGMANLKFTDEFTLRAELLYSQKGVAYDYAGESFWLFNTQDDQPLLATGDRSTTLSITNSYIDIPIMAVGRFGRLELSGGLSVGFLISSRGSGELNFRGSTASGAVVEPFIVALDFNYFQERADANDTELQNIGGRPVEVPRSLNAYYELVDQGERLFNTVDVGLVGGAAFYINQGLFLGLRVNYGLSDITKTERDFSRRELGEDNTYIQLDDDDRNLVLQASIGFSF